MPEPFWLANARKYLGLKEIPGKGTNTTIAGWLAKLQVKGDVAGTPLAGERGAIAYDKTALKTAKQNGIDNTTRDQWRRAGAQGASGLLALARC